VNRIAHCVGLYHITDNRRPEENHMTYSITKKDISPQPVLIVAAKVSRSGSLGDRGYASAHFPAHPNMNRIGGATIHAYIQSRAGAG